MARGEEISSGFLCDSRYFEQSYLNIFFMLPELVKNMYFFFERIETKINETKIV